MTANDTPSTQQPPVTPEAFFKEKVAPQFRRRIDDLRRQILSLEQQVQERMAAQATVRVVIEGEGGGTWYLNVNGGEMTVTAEPVFPPLMTVYQPIRKIAETAAELAVPLAKGSKPSAGLTPSKVDNGAGKVPSALLDTIAITKNNVKSTVVKDGFLKTSERPFRPIGIVGHEIEQNVRVNEDHSALAARHGQDFVCAQTLSGMAAKAGEPVRLGLTLDLD